MKERYGKIERGGILFCILGIFLLTCAPMSFGQAEDDEAKETFKPTTRKQVKYVKPSDKYAAPAAKIDFIRRKIQSFVDFKDDITNPKVINTVYDEINSAFPLQPEGTADLRTSADLRKIALENIRKHFPKDIPEFRKDLEKAAGEKFRIYRIGEYVTVRYMRSDKVCEVKGIFYSFDGRAANIDLKIIPFFDILETDKVHISEAYSKKKRDAFMTERLTDYVSRRSKAIMDAFNVLREAQKQTNIDTGYLLFGDVWCTPKQIADKILIEQIKATVTDKEKLQKIKNLDSLEYIQQAIASEDFNRMKLHERAQSLKAGTVKYAGSIDMEQGYYDTVFWGFTKSEVKFLLEEQGLHFIPGDEYDTVSTSDRQITQVRLYYENGRFNKVVFVYGIRIFDEFLGLKKSMLQRYGQDDISKQKKFVRPGDPVAWSGLVTDGHLFIRQNEKTGAIEEITMTREAVSPAERAKREAAINAAKKKIEQED